MPHHATNPAVTSFRTQAEAIVARQEAHNAAAIPYGVCWSGLSRSPYVKVERVDDVEAQLRASWAKYQAWSASPRGRFYGAIAQLQDDEPEAFHRLYGFWSRSLADGREPLNLEAVAACLRVLAPLDCQAAQEAELALADLLAAAAPQMKAAA